MRIRHDIFTGRAVPPRQPSGEPLPNGFTMLELIMVVGVLSVLLAIILPAPRMAREATLKKQAKAEATALAQAAIRYKAEYGFWPGEVLYDTDTAVKQNPNLPIPAGMIAAGPVEFTSNITMNEGAMGYLSLNTNEVYQAFSTVGYPGGNGYKINPLNPKAIPFLDLKDETDFDRVNFPDPWGQPYRLIMGLNPKSMFTFEVSINNVKYHDVSVSNVTAFAFSMGPSGLYRTNYIYSAGVVE
ncbi:MAG: prepilin-type N-terminal cleavage/methylation domain-containing protein [Kiritimatiellaeota bacterium]|nr:prepilin-type N-terminal cleavage/methylation domain-containing protein [Kiritimatiellota bacterium]